MSVVVVSVFANTHGFIVDWIKMFVSTAATTIKWLFGVVLLLVVIVVLAVIVFVVVVVVVVVVVGVVCELLVVACWFI